MIGCTVNLLEYRARVACARDHMPVGLKFRLGQDAWPGLRVVTAWGGQVKPQLRAPEGKNWTPNNALLGL